MSEHPWEIVEGEGPLVAAAIHDGHSVRDEVAEQISLSEAERLREEDPFTGALTAVAETRIVVGRSRFEVDLNRPREKAVYRKPEDAWGLKVWQDEPSESLVDRSLDLYDSFYLEAHRIFTEKARIHGRFVVLDLHSYNHRREGPLAPPAPPEGNPEVNVGTGAMDRAKWSPLVEGFIRDLRAFDYMGRNLDVRENVKFRGGHFSRWIHESFPDSGCSLAIEFKKFFMDEWTGEIFETEHAEIFAALQATIPGMLNLLGNR